MSESLNATYIHIYIIYIYVYINTSLKKFVCLGHNRKTYGTYGKSNIIINGLLATSLILSLLEFLVLQNKSLNENPKLPFYKATTEKFLTIKTGKKITAKLWLLIYFSVKGLKRLIISSWSRSNLILELRPVKNQQRQKVKKSRQMLQDLSFSPRISN